MWKPFNPHLFRMKCQRTLYRHDCRRNMLTHWLTFDVRPDCEGPEYRAWTCHEASRWYSCASTPSHAFSQSTTWSDLELGSANPTLARQMGRLRHSCCASLEINYWPGSLANDALHGPNQRSVLYSFRDENRYWYFPSKFHEIVSAIKSVRSRQHEVKKFDDI